LSLLIGFGIKTPLVPLRSWLPDTKEDLAKLKTVTSLEGTEIEIDIDGDTLEVNNATVVTADIEADNGIIHAIDNVILMRPHWVANIMTSGRKSMGTGICG
jgi:hypothetical protein